MMKTIVLPNGRILPRMGLGTWRIGDDADKEAKEIDAIRYGIDQGIRILDTAEMYGEGKSEILLGKAIQGFPRKELFLQNLSAQLQCFPLLFESGKKPEEARDGLPRPLSSALADRKSQFE